MPDAALVRKTGTAKARPAVTTPPRFRHRPYAFDTSSVVPLRSSSCQSPDLVLSRPFPPVLTTMAFDHSRRRWFETCSCKPIPRGRPSSVVQLRAPAILAVAFTLVAHSHRHISRTAVVCTPHRLGLRRGIVAWLSVVLLPFLFCPCFGSTLIDCAVACTLRLLSAVFLVCILE